MSDIRNAIALWCRRGYYPVPIPFREKGPQIQNWQNLRITEADVPRYWNGERLNVGVMQGEPCGHADIDLDCTQAITAWPHFAPDTRLIFGHQSKPRSHWFYCCDPPARTQKYLDPLDHATLLEFRCLAADGKIGLQTLAPPSIHPSGEPIEFWRDCNLEPANVDADELGRAVRWTAAVTLLARHWPQAGGGRHDAFLALAGALAHGKWGLNEATHLICGLYSTLWPGNADLNAAMRETETTFRGYDDGHETTGVPALCKLVHPAAVKAAGRWLGLRQETQPETKKVFYVRSLPLAWQMEGGQMEWVIENLVAAGSVTLLSGDSGAGKSTLALQLAGCVAHGDSFLAKEVKRRPVLYVDRENPLFVVKERLHRLRIPETQDLIIWGLWNEPQPQGPDAESVLKFCADEKPLVIFDALIAFHEGDEQSAQDTRRHMGKYRKLAALGATVILLHNTGKSESAKQYRGSSDIKAALDMAYLLETLGDTTAATGLSSLRLVPFKTRVEPLNPIPVAYADGRFELNDSRQATERELFEQALRLHPGSSGRELMKLLDKKVPQRRVSALLLEGLQAGWVEFIPGGRGSGQRYRLREPDLDSE